MEAATPGRELTVYEAAQLLRVSEPTLRCAIQAGTLRARRHLGRVRLTQADLDAFVRARSR
jgi:excisionase family DNA binding protein